MSSMLEDILGGALGQAGIGGESSEGGLSTGGGLVGMLLPAVIGMLANGGLSNILGKMQSEELSAQADSWVGDGENLPISPEQAKEVVGAEQVQALASQAGLSEDQAATVLADALPQVVDEVSPEGRLPDTATVDDAFRKPRRKRRRGRGGGADRPRAQPA